MSKVCLEPESACHGVSTLSIGAKLFLLSNLNDGVTGRNHCRTERRESCMQESKAKELAFEGCANADQRFRS